MVLEPQHAVEGDLEEPQPAIPHLGGALRIRRVERPLADAVLGMSAPSIRRRHSYAARARFLSTIAAMISTKARTRRA